METSQARTTRPEPRLPDRFVDDARAVAVLDQRGAAPPSVAPAADPADDRATGRSSKRATRRGARDGRGLLPIAWLKGLWLLTQLAALAAGVVDPGVGATLAAGSMLLLVMWSGVAAINVRRARPRTVYSHPPHPLTAALAWLAPFAVVAVAIGVSGWIESNDPTITSASDDRVAQIRILIVAAAALPFVIALYLPYGVLGRATAWAGGNRRHWQYFFVLPLLTSLLAGLINRLLSLIVGSSTADDTIAATRTAALVLFVGLVLLPLVLAWLLGWRAMSETEHAARMTWERRNFPEGELDLSDELVARAVVATYLASHPDG